MQMMPPAIAVGGVVLWVLFAEGWTTVKKLVSFLTLAAFLFAVGCNEPAKTSAPKAGGAPATKAADKPGEKPADKPAEKPAEKPADKPADKPAEKPAEKPADQPGEKKEDKKDGK